MFVVLFSPNFVVVFVVLLIPILVVFVVVQIDSHTSVILLEDSIINIVSRIKNAKICPIELQ